MMTLPSSRPLLAAVLALLFFGGSLSAHAQANAAPRIVNARQDIDTKQDIEADGPLFTVHMDDGSAVAGHQLQMDPNRVRLLVERQLRDIPMTTVRSIDRQGDSLKNGAIVGAAVLGGFCALACLQGVDNREQYAGVLAINTAYGALIGLFIDWRIHGTTTVYRAPGKSSRNVVPSVTPAIAPGRSSLAFRWRW